MGNDRSRGWGGGGGSGGGGGGGGLPINAMRALVVGIGEGYDVSSLTMHRDGKMGGIEFVGIVTSGDPMKVGRSQFGRKGGQVSLGADIWMNRGD